MLSSHDANNYFIQNNNGLRPFNEGGLGFVLVGCGHDRRAYLTGRFFRFHQNRDSIQFVHVV